VRLGATALGDGAHVAVGKFDVEAQPGLTAAAARSGVPAGPRTRAKPRASTP
jgi:hypothetical protein